MVDSMPSPARISFSTDFLHDTSSSLAKQPPPLPSKNQAEFEFHSHDNGIADTMITADELFCDGKLLPFRQPQQIFNLNKMGLELELEEEEVKPSSLLADTDAAEPRQLQQQNYEDEDRRIQLFLDDDPSPRPPKCIVLWKELLRIKKKHRHLSPSSSTSSSSTSTLSDSTPPPSSSDEKKQDEKRRTRIAGIRIRPVITVPICSQAKNTSHLSSISSRRGRPQES